MADAKDWEGYFFFKPSHAKPELVSDYPVTTVPPESQRRTEYQWNFTENRHFLFSLNQQNINEVFAWKEQKEIGQLKHNKPCRLH